MLHKREIQSGFTWVFVAELDGRFWLIYWGIRWIKKLSDGGLLTFVLIVLISISGDSIYAELTGAEVVKGETFICALRYVLPFGSIDRSATEGIRIHRITQCIVDRPE